jgi:hypothetical protein
MSRIGLLNEKPLHASLKQWYAQPGDRFEVPLDGFVIDIVRDNVLLEIQTRHFGAIKSKLATLVSSHRVRLIYPIPQEKWIVQSPTAANAFGTRRKSPKRGRVEDLFRELVAIPHLLSQQNFSLEVLLTKEEGSLKNAGCWTSWSDGCSRGLEAGWRSFRFRTSRSRRKILRRP